MTLGRPHGCPSCSSVSGEPCTSGEILIDGRIVNDDHPKDRDIAMVFQTYALYPHMTVAENMGFSLRMRRASEAEKEAKVRTAAGILNLTDLLDRYPRHLSGGQRQRVAMGRAIVRDPKVFLFDEPLSNLDAQLRVRMRAEIRELHMRLKTTIVYVTHDQIEAMTMADKIVVMNGGKVEQVGRPLELFDYPANLFVAGFLGSPAMNLIPGRISAGSESVFESTMGVKFRLGKRGGLPSGRDVVLGVRPEHLFVDEGGSDFVVSVVEPTGTEVLAVCKAGQDEVVVLFKERRPIAPGDTIRLSMAPQNVHLFDAGTGERLDW
jgi:multiple sugar transport system ATP-binding protein